jgi:hypothetical protein
MIDVADGTRVGRQWLVIMQSFAEGKPRRISRHFLLGLKRDKATLPLKMEMR